MKLVSCSSKVFFSTIQHATTVGTGHMKELNHRDTALHFMPLRADVPPWFKKSSVELLSVQGCDARKES
jgi:hypothetical protein